LGQALGELLVAAGVVVDGVGLTGPQLISTAKHWAEGLRKEAGAG